MQNTLDEIGRELRTWCAMPPELRARDEDHPAGRRPFRADDARARRVGRSRALFASGSRAGVPFLGICLGLQALFESSEEAPEVGAWASFRARCSAFRRDARVPHMGWNDWSGRPSRLLRGLGDAAVRVFRAQLLCAGRRKRLRRRCTYARPLHGGARTRATSSACSSIPEKSGPVGLQIVRNFVEL